MNENIFPCLWFNGDGKEAADFYCEIFAGKITADTPVVLNLDLFGQKLMFLNAGPQFKKNTSISFTILCKTVEELGDYWTQLLVNGSIIDKLDEYPWSKKYGWLVDQFGVSWQLYLDENQAGQKLIPTLICSGQNKGNAQKMLEKYTAIFPNSKVGGILKYDSENTAATSSSELIQHSDFTLDNYSFYALDRLTDSQDDFTEGISLVVMTDDQVQTDHLWNSLISQGGRPAMCGWLKDEFGVSWQIVPKKLLELMNDLSQPQKAQKVVEAMMSMQKIIIEDLETAFNS